MAGRYLCEASSGGKTDQRTSEHAYSGQRKLIGQELWRLTLGLPAIARSNVATTIKDPHDEDPVQRKEEATHKNIWSCLNSDAAILVLARNSKSSALNQNLSQECWSCFRKIRRCQQLELNRRVDKVGKGGMVRGQCRVCKDWSLC